jgi:hypothetical protein
MKTLQPATDNVQEPKREAQRDTYRAPRLMSLGSAVGLVQAGISGNALDSGSNPYANKIRV